MSVWVGMGCGFAAGGRRWEMERYGLTAGSWEDCPQVKKLRGRDGGGSRQDQRSTDPPLPSSNRAPRGRYAALSSRELYVTELIMRMR